jgi:hypothetical protein
MTLNLPAAAVATALLIAMSTGGTAFAQSRVISSGFRILTAR